MFFVVVIKFGVILRDVLAMEHCDVKLITVGMDSSNVGLLPEGKRSNMMI